MRSTFAVLPALFAAAIAAPAAPSSTPEVVVEVGCESATSTLAANTLAAPTVAGPSVSPTSSLQAIELAAHGTLPNGALPKSISATTQAILEVIATNELFESAFFTELIANITNNVPGYQNIYNRDIVLRDLKAILAQEELHATGANAILATAGHPTILPCKYDFAATNFAQAIQFIQTVTDVVLGTLQEVAQNFATDGDAELVGLIGSIIGQEGEQNGWYRAKQDLIPSALPFLTAASGAFAYSAINQNGIIPGTCPNATAIAAAGIPIFKPLTIVGAVNAATTSINFSVPGTLNSNTSIVYVNQQNVPVRASIGNTKTANGVSTFSAVFPYAQYEMNGLTIVAVVNGTYGNLTTAGSVAAQTVYGPGLIEIN